MAVPKQVISGELVKKSNALARARWEPTSIWEPRIVALIASKVREDDDDFHTYKIPISELFRGTTAKLDGATYNLISESIARLGKATIRIQGKKPSNFRQYAIFAMCGYEDGCVIAEFHPDLKPHFLSLKANFTAYNLLDFIKLPSSYSQRMYELLKSWDDKPEYVASLTDLHDFLNTPPSLRKNFSNFRLRVLEKVHKDIQAQTSLRFEWQPVKRGRSIAQIRFLFSRSRQTKVSDEKKQEQALHKAQLLNSRIARAMECARRKEGICEEHDNKPILCKICMRMGYCAELKKRFGD